MKMLRALLAVLCFTFALSAKATPITVTINVPQMSWVDPGGNVVSPYLGPNSYMDSGGKIWSMLPGISQPIAAGVTNVSSAEAALMYTSYDCSGSSAYVNLNPYALLFSGMVLNPASRSDFFVLGAPMSVALHSAWYNNTCNAYANAASPYLVYAVTYYAASAPTLPTGPYHIELR